jgi:sugar lactone lactonase YvrE
MHIPLSATRPLGRGLARPECVLACRDGSVFTPDWRGGVTRIQADGSQESLLPPGLEWLRPNSLTLLRDGSIVLAHLADDAGGVVRAWNDGRWAPLLMELDGSALPPTNFVLADGDDLWITVSTRHVPRFPARRPGVFDGYVILMRDGAARIVADGIGFANEVRIDAERRHLYVAETFARRISRFPLRPDGLGPGEVFAELGPGNYPDGIAFDAENRLWATSIVSNRLLRFAPDGSFEVVMEDCEPAELAAFDADYESGRLAGIGHIEIAPRTLGNLSSLAFGGPDLSKLYLGCLLKDEIRVAPSPVPGLPMPHWGVVVPPFSGTSRPGRARARGNR